MKNILLLLAFAAALACAGCGSNASDVQPADETAAAPPVTAAQAAGQDPGPPMSPPPRGTEQGGIGQTLAAESARHSGD